MQKGSVAIGALWAAVLALIIVNIIVLMRFVSLQAKVAKLEGQVLADGGKEGAEKTAGETAADPKVASKNSTSSGTVAGQDPAARPATDTNPGGASTNAARDGGRKSSMSEEDITALIDKKLAEQNKKNPLISLLNFEDPMAVMERELKLSDLQKTRIKQHWKERDDAMQEIFRSEEARKDWKSVEEKQKSLQETCEESVKRELTLDQQEKYTELKKSGKLMDFGGAGASIVFEAPAINPGPEPEPAK